MQRLLILIVLLFLIKASALAQYNKITVSGLVRDNKAKTGLPFVNVALNSSKDSSFIVGTITNEEGRFTLVDIKSGTII